LGDQLQRQHRLNSDLRNVSPTFQSCCNRLKPAAGHRCGQNVKFRNHSLTRRELFLSLVVHACDHPRRARLGGAQQASLFAVGRPAALRLGRCSIRATPVSGCRPLRPSFRSGESKCGGGFQSPSPRVLGGLLVAIKNVPAHARLIAPALKLHWRAAQVPLASSRQRFSKGRRVGSPGSALRVVCHGKQPRPGGPPATIRRDPHETAIYGPAIKKIKVMAGHPRSAVPCCVMRWS